MSTTLLREAIRRGLKMPGIAGATLAFASVAPAMAQDAPAPQANQQQLETVTVTGSRIRKADVETAQPIVVLDRAAIEKQGFNSVVDILQNLSETGSPPISRASALASGEEVGGTYIDMRNLGASRTLILLNGKRLGASTGGAQDLSQIPMASIERIEVLKDGASAIYGSDAISGVVNIITRKNYDGAEASAYVGEFDEGDGAKQTYSMTIGTHGERGSITLAAEYSKEDPIWAKNRPYSAYGNGARHPEDALTAVSQWGMFFFPDGSCPGQDDGFGGCTLNPGGNPLDPNDYHGTGSAGGTSDLTNSNEQMTLQTGIERHSLFLSGEYNISDNVKFSTDFLYNKRSTLQQAAGYPYNSITTFHAMPLSAESYYNPFGIWHGYDDPQDIHFYRRGWEVPRTSQLDLSTYRFAGTFSGEFEVGERTWNWDVGGYVNRNESLQIKRGNYSLVALGQALGPSFLDPETGLVTCGTPDNPIPYGTNPGSCIPWNPMYSAGQVGQGSLSGNPALQSYLFPFYKDTGVSKETDYSANITGPLFTLPAGDLSLAAGIEHRNVSGSFLPDAATQQALTTDLSAGPTSGKYKVDEFYLEVDVPVLKDIPFARELTFNVAGRYSKYDSFGNTTNGKFGLTWRPIEDLLVRGNYAQGFRAPTISDLYGGLGANFAFYTDPCDTRFGAAAASADVLARCNAGIPGLQPGTPDDFRQPRQGGGPCTVANCQTPFQFFNGSNANLQPEKSTTKTAGIVYSPNWLSGLDISADWWRVHIKDAIQFDSATGMLQDCYIRNTLSRCSPNLFQRDPATGAVGVATLLPFNAGWIDTEGWDLGIAYRLPEFSFGRFALRLDSTYVSHLDVKSAADAPVSGNTGLYSNFRLRSNLSLDWTLGSFGATWTTRYYSSIKEDCVYEEECTDPDHTSPDTGSEPGSYPLNRTGANAFHDLQVRWTAPWNGTISVGANNVFDHVGPTLYTQPNSNFAYYGGFDYGRFYYLRYTQKF